MRRHTATMAASASLLGIAMTWLGVGPVRDFTPREGPSISGPPAAGPCGLPEPTARIAAAEAEPPSLEIEEEGARPDYSARNAILMKEFLTASNDDERERILDTMPKFDDPSTISFFASIARDHVRYSARIRARGVIGLNLRDCREAVEALREVAQGDPDSSIRFLALEGMGTNVDCREEVLPILLAALGDPDALARQGALIGLQFLGDPRAVGAVAAWIEREPDTRLAADAVILLGKYEGEEATQRLRGLASAHSDAAVRERAWQALVDRGDAAAIGEFRRRAAAGDGEAKGRLAARDGTGGTEGLVEALRGEDGPTVALDLARRAADGDGEALAALEAAMDPEWPDAARFRAAAEVARRRGLDRGAAEKCLRMLGRETREADVRKGALTELFCLRTPDGLRLCEAAAGEGGEIGAHALALVEAYGIYGGRRGEAEQALLRIGSEGAAACLLRVREGKADPSIVAWLDGTGLPPRRLLKAGDAVAHALLRR